MFILKYLLLNIIPKYKRIIAKAASCITMFVKLLASEQACFYRNLKKYTLFIPIYMLCSNISEHQHWSVSDNPLQSCWLVLDTCICFNIYFTSSNEPLDYIGDATIPDKVLHMFNSFWQLVGTIFCTSCRSQDIDMLLDIVEKKLFEYRKITARH
jgi:hypothetical protein